MLAARRRPGPPAPPSRPWSPRSTHATVPLSSAEVDYPLLRDAYENSSFEREAEVQDWRERAAAGRPRDAGADAADRVCRRPRRTAGRAARRDHQAPRVHAPVLAASRSARVELSTALCHATRGWPADVPSGLVDLYVNVHAVDGVEPGAYVYRPDVHALELMSAGDFRRESAFLAWSRRWAAPRPPCSSSPTSRPSSRVGQPRIPRRQPGGRPHRAGASTWPPTPRASAPPDSPSTTGEVVHFFSPHAAGMDAIFVTALGRSVRRSPRTSALLMPRR